MMKTKLHRVPFGAKTYTGMSPWDGSVLATPTQADVNRPLSFDTETEYVPDLQRGLTPRLALATAAWGDKVVLILPHQLCEFISLHRDCHWVAFNVVFDWWVVRDFLATQAEASRYLAIWLGLVDDNRFADAMILDQLLRLSRNPYPFLSGSDQIRMRDLGSVCRDYLKTAPDKEDPYRKRYGEVLADPTLLESDEGFVLYALKDAIATHALYPKLKTTAENTLRTYNRLCPIETRTVSKKTVERYGLLSLHVQVKAAISVFASTRAGLKVDLNEAAKVTKRLEEQMEASIATMRELQPTVFRYEGNRRGDLPGQLFLPGCEPPVARNAKTGTPKLIQSELRNALSGLAVLGDLPLPLQCVDAKAQRNRKTKADPNAAPKISLSTKAWADNAALGGPFLNAWLTLNKMTKALALQRQFTAEPIIRPRYTPLLVTGRMSASKPNLQQAIREDWFRRQFVARPNHVLYTVDYSFIELRTLAAVCKRWFGFSALADTVLAGKDPHSYTATMIEGNYTYEQFVAELKREKAEAKEAKDKGIPYEAKFAYARQKSKALNFGIPGGLGKRKLAAYAHASYGVKMSEEEAGHLRKTLIKVVYPELDCYLAESDAALRLNLRVADLPSPRLARGLRSLYSRVKDHPEDKSLYRSGAWHWLKTNCRPAPTKLRGEIDRDKFSESLERWLFADTIPTLTGRLRGGCLYSQAKNTPFQALAADGAKLALWRLFMEGYRVVAFVHDEFVLELLDDDEVPLHTRRIDRILNESMESVLGGVVPSAVEGSISTRWSK